MDTFSSSVSTLKVPSLPPPHREFYHFKSSPYASPNRPQAQAHVSSVSKPNLIPKTKPFSRKNSSPLVYLSSPRTPSSPNPIFYRKPSTGYAAAVVDVAQSSDSLHLVQKDVQRLLGFLKNVNLEESAMVKVVLEQGRFHRHLVSLVKMLLKKNRIGIVREVLEEFERIYDELCGTQVVLVPSTAKMGQDQLFGIAKNVHKLSGAVKVKVRNLVQDERLPSFPA
ncbi:ATP synthase delta chain, chloroplastic [Senna tora]|uniref:ATP synthase delta chain, chloroplastic n=1 Tax=Senna tora TaxID=362788 RepID=A0A834WMD7_9FABA|nr:ATP synthase delta chain, chloroplastic [Senna tora]